MEVLKKMTMSICVLSLVYSIMMLLTPDRFKRQVRSVLSIITAITIGGIILNGGSWDGIFSSLDIPSAGTAESADRLVISELQARLNVQIKKLIEEKGVPLEKVDTVIDIDEDNCIFISRLLLEVNGTKSEYEERIRNVVKSEIGDVNLETVFTEESDGP